VFAEFLIGVRLPCRVLYSELGVDKADPVSVLTELGSSTHYKSATQCFGTVVSVPYGYVRPARCRRSSFNLQLRASQCSQAKESKQACRQREQHPRP
jgi:hypothetical protein